MNHDAKSRSSTREPARPEAVSVPAWGLANLLVFAFRYALGRQTMAVPLVGALLREYGHVLSGWQRQQMIDDIREAIAQGRAGASCDERVWRRVAARLREETEGTP